MTRRVVVFKCSKTKKMYATPEFNGDKAEFIASNLSSDNSDSCDKNWHDIISEFSGITTLLEFKRANIKAQNYYHSRFGNEIIAVMPVDKIPLADEVYLCQSGIVALIPEDERKYMSLSRLENLLFDELGNRKIAHEIIRYEKNSDGQWYETDRYNTLGRSVFVINNKIYHAVGDSLMPVNMNFDSPTCGACERILSEIPITHKITKNETLYTFMDCGQYHKLQKQSYSDTPPFYSIQDTAGRFNLGHGNNDLAELSKTLDKRGDFTVEIRNKIKELSRTENPSAAIAAKDALKTTFDGVSAAFKNKAGKNADGNTPPVTEFKRKAHYRTGKDGQKYKVKGSTVTRNKG